VALAFGFGGQEAAARLIEQSVNKGKEAAANMPSAADKAKQKQEQEAQSKPDAQSRELGSETRGSRPAQS